MPNNDPHQDDVPGQSLGHKSTWRGSLMISDWPTPGVVDPDEWGLFVKALRSYHEAQKHAGTLEECKQALCVRMTSKNFEDFRSRMTGYVGAKSTHKGHGQTGECACRQTDRQSCAANGCVVCRSR